MAMAALLTHEISVGVPVSSKYKSTAKKKIHMEQ